MIAQNMTGTDVGRRDGKWSVVSMLQNSANRDFGRRWKAGRKRLGLPDASVITVLADGAKGIGEEQRRHLCGADGVLDIFDAWQHLSDLSKALHNIPDETSAWIDRVRTVLLESGWPGLETWLVSP